MDRKAIIKQFSKAKSPMDFLDLLNALKTEEFGAQAFPFKLEHLFASCNPRNPGRYKIFTIPKKSGGARQIAAPSSTLKSLLRYTKSILEAHYNPLPCVQGFTIGRSVVGNASMHLHQNYVFNVDLSNFFPSISQSRVWKRLQLAPYNFPDNIARIIAGMSCVAYKMEDGTTYNALPQGAPTSPLLSNMICEQMDRRLTGLAKRFGLHFSRYADDMTFSSMHNVYQPDGAFMQELTRIITEQGFRFNEKKTRLQKVGQKQDVTGLTVGEKVNVSRKYIKELRSTLNVWEKFGYSEAYAWFYKRYKADKGYGKKGEPVLENVLEGKINYLKMVKGETDSTYRALRKRLDDLLATLQESRPKRETRHAKVSYTLIDFKRLFADAAMDFSSAPNGLVSGKLTISGITTPIYFDKIFRESSFADKAKILEAINNGTSDWYISEIEDTDKRVKHRFNHFWQISKYMPRIALKDQTIGVDRLLSEWEKNGIDSAIKLWKQGCTDVVVNNSADPVDVSHIATTAVATDSDELIGLEDFDASITSDDLDAFMQEIQSGLK
jgi:retron-type reverse transcriptase